MLSAQLLRSWWLAVVMLLTLAASLSAAVLVEVTRNTTLASLFLWRITVVMVPVAYVFIAVSIVDLVTRALAPSLITVATSVLAVGLAIVGVRTTVSSLNAPPSSLVAALRAAAPAGVGLVPLNAEDVRLNARLPVFVDWKSHPYAPEELTEWVRRVEAVRLAFTDDASLCRLVDEESIDWFVSETVHALPCFADWTMVDVDGTVIMQRLP